MFCVVDNSSGPTLLGPHKLGLTFGKGENKWQKLRHGRVSLFLFDFHHVEEKTLVVGIIVSDAPVQIPRSYRLPGLVMRNSPG